MRKFLISTEMTCDLSLEELKEKEIYNISLKYLIDDKEYDEYSGITNKELCEKLRSGANVTTSSVNIYEAKLHFEELLKTGKDILHISFSSGMSGSYNNLRTAVEELNSKYSNKIYLVDSLCASAGQGLLCNLAVEKADEGNDILTVYNYVEEMKKRICHIFTVDDLKFLQRTGRISKMLAQVGTLLKIKPVLNLDNDGCIVQNKNVISRKKAISTLADMVCSKISQDYNKVYISHADCLEDVEILKTLIKQKLNIDAKIYNIGCVIASHSGPGTLAIFFVGNER